MQKRLAIGRGVKLLDQIKRGGVNEPPCQFNPRSRSLEGGGVKLTPPSIFLALNFCSLTDCQKLWHNCSLFVNTSFDIN